MTGTNGNGWRTFALQVAVGLLGVLLGLLAAGVRNDHQRIQDHERRITVLEVRR